MVEPRVFIFLGSDELEKHKRIELLQQKIFPPSLKDLNYTLFYGDEKHLTPSELTEALTCFPTEGAKKRLVVIKMAHKLKPALQACLAHVVRASENKTMIILDVPELKGSEGFVDEFSKMGAQMIRFRTEVAPNVFDLGRAVQMHHPETALKILSGLLRYREKTEKILGALFWQWERFGSDKRMSQDSYKKGLKLILEADKRLKNSSSAYARQTLILEALVVKLAYLSH